MTSSGTTAESARSIACQIDGIDTCILNMLEKDGRATLAQLSEATGLSVSAVQSRVQKLERRGVISGYKAIIDDEKRGLPVSAYIAVTPHRLCVRIRNSGKTARCRWHHVVRFRGRLAQLHAHRACGIAKQARRAAQRHSPNRSGKHRNHDRAAALLRKVAVLW